MADMAVELAVFVVGDVGAQTGPHGLGLVDDLELQRGGALLGHVHREGQVVGIATHQRAQAPDIGKFLRVLLQVQA